MRKGKNAYGRKQYMPNRKKDALDEYDIKNFMVDNAVIASFDSLDRSKRDWIITRRYELQDSSPVSERHNVVHEKGVPSIVYDVRMDFDKETYQVRENDIVGYVQ